MDHLIKDVNEAWMDQKGKSLPSMHADTAAAWVAGKWPDAAKTIVVSPRPSVEAGAPAPARPADLEDEDMVLFGTSGPTARETAQLKADKTAQGLSGVEIAVLALALELDSIPPVWIHTNNTTRRPSCMLSFLSRSRASERVFTKNEHDLRARLSHVPRYHIDIQRCRSPTPCRAWLANTLRRGAAQEEVSLCVCRGSA